MRVAVKPIPSIHKEQQTVDIHNQPATIKVGGRHDISAIPRIVPVCEAMVRLTLADHLLRQMAIVQVRGHCSGKEKKHGDAQEK
jgi:chorismate synthase